MLIARYTTKASGVVPIFNDGFTYTVNETVSNGIYTVEISSNSDFSVINFNKSKDLLTVEYLKITNKVTELVRNGVGMFESCTALTYVNTEGWDTSNITNIAYMFYGCTNLAQVNTINFTMTNKLINADQAFYNCNKLTQLDLSGWDLSGISRIYALFYYCSSLSVLNLSNWKLNNATNVTSSTLLNCTNLTQVFMKNSDFNSVNKIIEILPTQNSGAFIDVAGVDDINQVNITVAATKNWEVVNITGFLVAKYTTDASGFLPTFNDGYVYSVNESLSNGIYTVEIYAENDFESCSFYNQKTDPLLTVEYLKITNKVTAFNAGYYGMFDTCKKLTYVNTEGWDTSNVTNMNYMFYNCNKLAQIDVSNWNIGNVTSMQQIFYNCNSLTQLDLSNWNINNVTSMYQSFSYCSSLMSLNIDGWNMATVTNVGYMLNGCSSLSEIFMRNTDYNSVGKILTLLPTRTAGNPGVLDISGIDNITQIDESSANSKYWNIINNTENPIPNDFVLVAKYTSLYSDLLPTFNTGYQYRVNETYENGVYTTEIYSADDFSFFNLSDATDLLTVEYLKVTNNVTSFCNNNSRGMFDMCTALTYVNTEGWDTSNVTDMTYMFYKCQSLTSVDLSNFNTSKVTNMYNMFYNCNKLAQIDISNWNIKESTYMSSMFAYCSSLVSINFGDINLPHINNLDKIIYMDNALKEVTCNVSSLAKIQSQLPLRSSSNKGTIICKDLGDFDTYELKSKYWEVSSANEGGVNPEPEGPVLIARYTASSNNVFPTFNSGYQYTTEVSINNDGTYTIELYSETDFTYCTFQSLTTLLTVDYLKVTNNVTAFTNNNNYGMFDSCSNLTSINTEGWDTSNVTNMAYMFYNCSSLSDINLNNINTESIVNMNYAFYNCTNLVSIDISNWLVSNSTSMNGLFYYCTSLKTINMGNLDIGNLANASGLFYNCNAIKEVTCNVSTLGKIQSQLPTRSEGDEGTIICEDLGDFDTSTLESKYWNIGGKILAILVARYTANASGVVPTFNSGYQYTVDEVNNGDGTYTVTITSDSDFSNVNFKKKSKLLTVEYLKVTSNVTDMGYMFYNCSSLTQLDVSNWDTGNVKSMDYMFYNCESLIQLNASIWDTSNVTKMNSMFTNCESLAELDVSNWNTGQVTTMHYMFQNCSSLTQLDLGKWNTSQVTNIGSMFNQCSSLTQLDVSNWDTSKATTTSNMFSNCSSLKSIKMNNTIIIKLGKQLSTRPQDDKGVIYCDKLDGIDTSSIEDKNWKVVELVARYTCNASGVVPTFNSGYEYIVDEVSNGDGTYAVKIYADNDFSNVSFENKSNLLTVEYLKVTNKVTSTAGMFYNCDSATSLNLSDFDTSNVTEMWEMFCYCCSLETIIGIENWNTGKVTDLTYTFMCCESLTTLNLSGWNTSEITLLDGMFSDCTYLEELDISNWDLSNADPNWLSAMFYISELDPENDYWYNPDFKPYLKTIRCNNANTISLIAPYLPDRSTCEEAGIIIITDNASEVNAEELVNLNWKVVELIARYTCNASGVVPTFNSGYEYEVREVDNGDGTYTVKIYADEDFSSCSFKENKKLLTVEYLKVTSQVTNMHSIFYNCSKLTQLDVSNWDTSQVTIMRYMFYGCSSLTQLDVSNFNTSKVTDMYSMFNNCSSLTQLDVSNWDTSNVVYMYNMFYKCSSLAQLDVSNWDTSNVVYMNNMFYKCSSLNSIKTNNTNIIKLGQQLPARPQDDKGVVYCDDLDGIDVSSIEAKNWNIISRMLVARYTCKVSGVVPAFNSGYQYTVDETNNDGIYTVEIYSYDDFSSCSFYGKSNLLTVEYLKVTSKVTSMMEMFHQCSKLTQIDVSNWDTSQVTDMYQMFWYCSKLTQIDVSNWNTSNVTKMRYAFYNCESLTQLDVSNWDTSQVTDMYYMFYNCSFTQLDVSNWDTSQVTNMSAIFQTCKSLTQLDLSNWDTSKVTSIFAMFRNCSKLTQLDVSNFDINNVTDMRNIFDDCSSLKSIKMNNTIIIKLGKQLPTRPQDNKGTIYCDDLEGIDISSIEAKNWNIIGRMLVAKYTCNASGLVPTFNSGYQYTVEEVNNDGVYTVEIYSYDDFSSCSFKDKTQLLTVEYLKVTDNVTSMSSMFYNCNKLNQLDVSNWNTSKVTDMSNMFQNCKKITSLDVSKWDTGNVQLMTNMFDLCQSLQSLNLSDWNVSKVENMGAMFGSCYNLEELKIDNWNTSSLTNTGWMFNRLLKLKELNLSNWNVSKITNMDYMFTDCIELKTLILNGWNNIISNHSSIFAPYEYTGCSSLNYISMKNSDCNSVNKIIDSLLTRNATDSGILYIADVDDISQVNIELAKSKYWIVNNKMAMKPITEKKSMKQIKHGNRGVKVIMPNNK